MKKIWRYLARYIILVGILYIILSFGLYYFQGPFKSEIAGVKITFTNIIKPIRISISIILLGLFIKLIAKRPSKPDKVSFLALIFCIVLLIFLSSAVKFSPDSKWSVPTAKSITTEFNTDLNEYAKLIDASDYRIENVNGHLFSYFPVGASLLATPFALLFNDDVVISRYEEIELLVASVLMALASVFIYLISYRITAGQLHSVFITGIFAFCTSVWSTASRGLWHHGPTILVNCVTIYIILLAIEKPHYIQYLGLLLAFSFIIRPTNSIPIVMLTIFTFWKFQKYFVRFILWSLPISFLFLLYNVAIYGSFLSPYYTVSRIGHFNKLFEALTGNLFSPARGIFIFSPIIVFAFYGIYIRLKRKLSLDIIFLCIIFFHWIAISSFPKWWGGHCFGPRFFSDIIPYIIFFIIYAFNRITKLPSRIKYFFLSVFICLTIISFFIHYRGATDFECFIWNESPSNIDYNTERLWDWNDLQFLRGITE